MMNGGNGFWLNQNHITSICSIKESKRAIQHLKDRGFSKQIINLCGTRPAESCAFTKYDIVFLFPFTKDTMLKRKFEASNIDIFIKCGNGNWIKGEDVLLVADSNKAASIKLWNYGEEMGKNIDFTQGKGTSSIVLTKDLYCFRSPMNANTTSGHGRKLEEKRRKENQNVIE